ncbi:MAG: LysR family transcriptional regulator [Pseudomonadota bacterium]
MKNLNDARLFLRIVEAGSLKAAAEGMETDPATVTRRLAALETRLGVQLLQRARSGSTTTEAGELYYEGMRQLLDSVDGLEEDIAGFAQTPRGFLRVSCPVDLGARFVTHWLIELQRRHEGLEIELLLSDEYVDLAGQNIDVALRIGQLSDSALIARRLGVMPLMIVGAPRYLEQQGHPTSLRELAECTFVLYSWMQFGRSVALVDGAGAKSKLQLKSRLSINNVGAIREAVLGGAGLHIGPEWIFAEDLRSGALEIAAPELRVPATSISAVYRQGPFVPAKTRAVLDCFLEKMPTVDGVRS